MSKEKIAPMLISAKDAATLTTISRSALYYLSEKGQFPKPVRLTEKRIAFVRAEVVEWIANSVSSRG